MLTAIVLLPLLGFLLNGVLATQLGGNRVGKSFVVVVGCGLPLAAFALAVMALSDLRHANYAPLVEIVYRWALIGDSPFEIAFYFDRLSAVMTLVVTGVGSVIHIYSVGYMAHDKSFGRFFAYLNLFLFFMLLLVLGRSEYSWPGAHRRADPAQRFPALAAHPVAVVFDGSAVAMRALSIGSTLAGVTGSELTVLVPVTGTQTFNDLRQRAAQHLAGRTNASYLYLPDTEPVSIIRTARSRHFGVLLWPGRIEDLAPAQLSELPCPVVVIS